MGVGSSGCRKSYHRPPKPPVGCRARGLSPEALNTNCWDLAMVRGVSSPKACMHGIGGATEGSNNSPQTTPPEDPSTQLVGF